MKKRLFTKKGGHHTQRFRSPRGRDGCNGEFGTVVATEKKDLPVAIARLLAVPKPDAVALSQAVRARFGAAVFRARVGMALDRPLEPQSTPELISRVT